MQLISANNLDEFHKCEFVLILLHKHKVEPFGDTSLSQNFVECFL